MAKIIHSAGKRKCAVARATLKPGTGKVRVNYKFIEVFEPELEKMKIQEPLILAGDISKQVDVDIITNGGGISAQAEAARLAVARCLVQHSKKLEKVFLNYDRQLLVADVRRKETCKPNDSKARAKRQKSYR